jgi:death-on-curing protein
VSRPGIVWLLRGVVEAIHDEQIAWHGGQDGTRDAGLPERALARLRNLAAYGDPDLPALAASLGYGIARNHPFLDGNKRTAFVSVEAFLLLNGLTLTASDADCVLTIEKRAEGSLGEADFAAWVRVNVEEQA